MNDFDDFQSSDILGNTTPLGPGRMPQSSVSWRSLAWLSFGGLLAFYLAHAARSHFLRWKEKRYKLYMRRKFGIPDDDHRPFNVAYASAQLRQEEETKGRPRHLTSTRPGAFVDGVENGLRKRPGLTANHDGPRISLHQRELLPSEISSDRPRRQETLLNVHNPHSVQFPPSSSLSLGAKPFEDSHTESGESPESQPTAAAYDNDPDMSISELYPRKQKRLAESSDEEEEPMGRAQPHRHDKRRRKSSNKAPLQPHDDDVEMVDDISDLPPSRRGKKRDRTDADSTVGDDDVNDWNEEGHRHRRRRHRKSSMLVPRGQKRGRGSDITSDDEDGDRHRFTGRPFHRRSDEQLSADDDAIGDDSASQISRSFSTRGRRIGEEWEAHGFRYKIGPDGQRLTQALVLVDRPLYSMPQDSAHPDREASVQAISEQWLTDREIKEAKDRQVLAWQSPAKPMLTLETSKQAPLSGKEMLWQSPSVPGTPSPMKRSQGTLPITPLRVTALQPSVAVNFRRVTSSHADNLKFPEMSPKLHSRKSYTKWQRQEIEAAAMEKLRRKNEEEEAKKAAEIAKSTPQPAIPITMSFTPSASIPANTSKGPSAPSKPAESAQQQSGSMPNPTVQIPQLTTTAQAPVKEAKSLFTLQTGPPPAASAQMSNPGTQQPKPQPSVSTSTSGPSSTSVAPAFSSFPGIGGGEKSAQSASNNLFAPKAPGATGFTPAAAKVPAETKSDFSFAQPAKSSTPTSLFPSSSTPAVSTTVSSGPGTQQSIFGNTGPAATGLGPAAQQSEPPKFSFNASKAPAPATNATTSVAPPADAQKPSAPLFSFSKPATQPTPANATSAIFTAPKATEKDASTAKPPLFSFNASNPNSNSNPFLTQASGSTNSNKPPTSTGPFTGPPSPFVMPASSQGEQRVPEKPTSIFGTSNLAPNTPKSAFGGNAMQSPSTQPASSTPISQTTGTTAPIFSFGASTPSQTSAFGSQPGKPTSAFGSSSFPASNPTSTATPQSVFGAPSASPFANSASSGPSASQTASQPSAGQQTKSPFSFNFSSGAANGSPAASPFAAKPAGSGPFAFGEKKDGNVFGFGASSGKKDS